VVVTKRELIESPEGATLKPAEHRPFGEQEADSTVSKNSFLEGNGESNSYWSGADLCDAEIAASF